MRFHVARFLLLLLAASTSLATPATANGRGPVACTTCPQSVTGWWPLDETAGGVAVDVANRNDGLHAGAPAPVPGVVAGGLDFDGTDDYVAIPDADELDVGTGDFTVDAWIRTTDDGGVVTILDKRTDDANGVTGYSLFLSDGFLGFQMADGGGGSSICSTSASSSCTNYIAGTNNIADGGWHLVVVTVDRDNPSGLVFYVDGSQVGAAFNPTFRTGSLSNTSPLYFARRSFSAVAFFDGTIDEVELFGRALTFIEVQALWDADAAGKCKCTTAPDDLAAWWPFDDGISATADEIVAANVGTRVGGPAPVAGVVGGALDFDGVNDYVEVPDAPELDLGTGDFSFDFWIKTTEDSGVVTIVDKRVFSGGIGYSLYLYNGDVGIQLADGGHTNYNSSAFVADDQWHFVAVTVNRDSPTGLVFYLDGQITDTLSPIGRMGSLNNDSPLRVASYSFAVASLTDATIDELELFKRALTLPEIQALYAAGPAGKCKCTPVPADVAAWWPLNETAGTSSSELVAGNSGAHVNGPTPIAGRVRGALDFDGADDHVAVPDAPALDVSTGDFSLDLWVRTTGDSGVVTLLDKRTEDPGGVIGYSLFLSGGLLGFQLAEGGGSSICSTSPSASCTNYISGAPVANGQWRFVAVTVDRDQAAGGVFYVDGVPVGTFDPTIRPGSLSNASSLYLARRSLSAVAFLDGALDEVELFQRALDATEIATLYAAGPAGKCQEDFTSIFSDGFESGDTSKWSSTVP